MVLYSQIIVAALCCAEQLKMLAEVPCVTCHTFSESVPDSRRSLFTSNSHFYCEGGQALAQVAQGGCEVSILKDI